MALPKSCQYSIILCSSEGMSNVGIAAHRLGTAEMMPFKWHEYENIKGILKRS